MTHTKIKPILNFTLLCDDVRQELGGKYSLMGLFENITAHSFPAAHPRFAIVNEWSGGRGEFTVIIRLLAPDKEQVLSESETRINLFSEKHRHRDLSIRYNTTFVVPGTYWIETLLDNERVSLTPLSVQQVNPHLVH